MRRMAFSYGCVYIRLPQPLADEVRGYATSIPPSLRIRTEDAPDGIPDDVHITVKYGILTEDENDVAGALMGASPIVVKLGAAGVFHNPDAAVLKIGVESIGLRKLYNRICRELKTVDLHRDFHPHVTVAYLMKREDNPYYYRMFYSGDFEGREFEANQVVFSAASGQKSLISFNGETMPLMTARAARVASQFIRR